MLTLLAAGCAALATVVLLGPASGAARLRAIVGPRGVSVPGPIPAERTVTTAPAPGATVSGWRRALAAAVGARRRDRELAVAMLPLAADLMTAALASGCPPAAAAETVGTAIGGPLGRAFADAAAAVSVGVEPGKAWSDLAAEPAIRPLARALTAAMTRGSAPSQALARVSADARDAARWSGEARARALGARAAAPLGLCFLPAFVLVGVVPMVATSGLLTP